MKRRKGNSSPTLIYSNYSSPSDTEQDPGYVVPHFPVEIVEHILSFLRPLSLLRAQRVCRLWNKLAWQNLRCIPGSVGKSDTFERVPDFLDTLSYQLEHCRVSLPRLTRASLDATRHPTLLDTLPSAAPALYEAEIFTGAGINPPSALQTHSNLSRMTQLRKLTLIFPDSSYRYGFLEELQPLTHLTWLDSFQIISTEPPIISNVDAITCKYLRDELVREAIMGSLQKLTVTRETSSLELYDLVSIEQLKSISVSTGKSPFSLQVISHPELCTKLTNLTVDMNTFAGSEVDWHAFTSLNSIELDESAISPEEASAQEHFIQKIMCVSLLPNSRFLIGRIQTHTKSQGLLCGPSVKLLERFVNLSQLHVGCMTSEFLPVLKQLTMLRDLQFSTNRIWDWDRFRNANLVAVTHLQSLTYKTAPGAERYGTISFGQVCATLFPRITKLVIEGEIAQDLVGLSGLSTLRDMQLSLAAPSNMTQLNILCEEIPSSVLRLTWFPMLESNHRRLVNNKRLPQWFSSFSRLTNLEEFRCGPVASICLEHLMPSLLANDTQLLAYSSGNGFL